MPTIVGTLRRRVGQLIGVSAYEIVDALPERLKGSLPTVEELERSLGDAT